MATKQSKPRRPSLEIRLTQEEKNKIQYYADAENLSVSEWMVNAAEHYIRWKQSDYDLPTAEIQRLNQLVDVISGLTDRARSLEETVVNGFNATLGLMDTSHSYLIDEHTHPAQPYERRDTDKRGDTDDGRLG